MLTQNFLSLSEPPSVRSTRPVLIVLKPKKFPIEREGERFSGSFWVVPDAVGLERLREKKKDDKAFLQITPQDLRVDPRSIPSSSYIEIFGKQFFFDYNAPNLPEARINCIISIDEEPDEISDIVSGEKYFTYRGKILSGYVRFSRLDETPNGLLDPNGDLKKIWSGSEDKLAVFTLGSENVQIEIEGGSEKDMKRRLLQFVKTSDGGRARLWQLQEFSEGTQNTRVTPKKRIETLIAELNKNIKSEILNVRQNSDRQERSAVFYYVSFSINENNEPIYFNYEIVRPDIEIIFTETSTRFIPKTLLKFSQANEYQLLDYDEIEVIEREGKPRATPDANAEENSIDVTVVWENETLSLEKTPDLYLAGLDNERDPSPPSPYVWQFGSTAEENKPTEKSFASWIRYRIGDAPVSGRSIGDGWRRIDSVTTPLVVKVKDGSEEWGWTFDLPEREAIAGSPLRLRLRVRTENNVKIARLDMVRPTIKAVSPSIFVFNRSLADPEALPFTKDVAADVREKSLVFKNDAGKNLANYDGLKLVWTSARIVSENFEDAIAYRPAPEALIEIIPTSGSNGKPVKKSDERPAFMPRDPAQGLIPAGIKEFRFRSPAKDGIIYQEAREEEILIREKPTTAIMALLPWVQWQGTYSERKEVVLFHRNLVQEQAEFLTSASDRFSPQETPNSVFLPFDSFLGAVRDRFLEASTSLNPIGQLLNWLPGATLKMANASGQKINIAPRLEYSDDRSLPQVRLTFAGDTENTLSQILSLEQNNSWLNYDITFESEGTSSPPAFLLAPATNKKNEAINSSIALLFGNNYIYDNLGVLRSLHSNELPANSWLSEKIRFPNRSGEKVTYQTVISLSFYSSIALIADDPEGNITEIYFTCESLKLMNKTDREWILFDKDKSIPEGNFYLGVYAFYSSIESEKIENQKITDRWIRIFGIPLFVTRLLSLEFDNNFDTVDVSTAPPKKISLEAVLPNPAQIPIEENTRSRVPLFVQEALNKGAVIRVDLLRRENNTYGIENVTGNVLWDFSLNQQSDGGDIPSGRLARIQGTAGTRDKSIVITVDTPNCFGSLFGQLWNLEHQEFGLVGKKEKDNFVFFDQGLNKEYRLIISSDLNKLFDFKLKLRLETSIGDYQLNASISTDKKSRSSVILTCGKTQIPLNTKLVQGNYFCLQPPEKTDLGGFAALALVLWIEKERDSSNSEPPQFGSILIVERFQNRVLSIKSAGTLPIQLTGTIHGMTIFSSSDSENDKPRKQEICTGYLSNNKRGDGSVELHVAEQIISYDLDTDSWKSKANQSLSAYLKWSSNERNFQAPVSLTLKDSTDNSLQVDFESHVFYASQIENPRDQDSAINLVYPLSENTKASFKLQNARRLDDGMNRFCRLAIVEGAWKLYAIPSERIPIDFGLEAEAIVSLEKLPIRVPQLVHRDALGTRLRIVLADTYTDPENTSSEEFPASGRSGHWLLRPIQDTAKRGGDRLVLLDETIALVASEAVLAIDSLTENLLLIFRNPPVIDFSETIAKTFSLANLISISEIQSITRNNPLPAPLTEEPDPLTILTGARIREYLQKTGSVGVALHRTLKTVKSDSRTIIQYEYFNSPFYSLEQSLVEWLTISAFESLKVQKPLQRNSLDTLPGFVDSRLLLPVDISRQKFSLEGTEYRLFDTLSKEGQSYLSRTGDLPLRHIGYEKSKKSDKPKSNDVRTDRSEHFLLFEFPAYRESESSWFLPEFESPTSLSPTELNCGSFQPETLVVTYGLDKPGAMFQHRLQPCTAINGDKIIKKNLQLARSVDFALREPQQFKTSPGAKIELKCPVIESIDRFSSFNLKKIKLEWKDTLGAIKLLALDILPSSLGTVTDVSNTVPAKVNNILQMVVRLDQDLLGVTSDDPVLPISKEARSMNIYLIAKTKEFASGYSDPRTGGTTPVQLVPKIKFYKEGVTDPIVFELTRGNDIFEDPPDDPELGFFVRKGKSSFDWTKFSEFEIVLVDNSPSPIPPVTLIVKKQLKKVEPLQLSPKIAIVAEFTSESNSNRYRRNLLFGDAALPAPEVSGDREWAIEKDKDTNLFIYRVPDNDTITIPFPVSRETEPIFYIVKYLVGGQVLFDSK
jgi:hypothetical protein